MLATIARRASAASTALIMAPSHNELLTQCRQLIPPLSHSLHKGQAGRVGVVGGSKDYTGAPFFSSMTSLRLGSDMSHIICEPSAGAVIKTYSPDLIVHTVLKEDATTQELEEFFDGMLSRLHVLVVGPGLGRDEAMQSAGRVAVRMARKHGIYLVLDADGLWLAQNEPDCVKGYEKAVLTPNVIEFQRLCDSVKFDQSKARDENEAAVKLATALGGVTIVQKGAVDRITNGKGDVLIDSVEGSPRRCGGQGDLLSGSIATFLAWASGYQDGVGRDERETKDKIPVEKHTLLAAYAGSVVTRHTSRETFKKLKRSMQANDMIAEIGNTYETLFGQHDPKL